MKLDHSSLPSPRPRHRAPVAARRRSAFGFTLMEIAICIAIIGIALVGVIGILPYGMNTQRDTREETVISQDAATLLPIITRGARNADDLTNYVYGITNYWTLYKSDGTVDKTGNNGYSYTGFSSTSPLNPPFAATPLTNGATIVGILSTPEFVADAPNFPAAPTWLNNDGNEVYSNHIVAYVRSLSGLATEKPPQTNEIMVSDSFTYQLVVVNAPSALDTNTLQGTLFSNYNYQLWQNQREFRMTFYWPLLPSGKIGTEPPLTYRTTVAGQLAGGLLNDVSGLWLYFYEPQTFIQNTNAP